MGSTKSIASARSRDITFKAFVPWFHIQTLTLTFINNPHPTLPPNLTEKWRLFSRLAEHWLRDHLKSSFSPNFSGLHFYPTSYRVIRNQHRKIRRSSPSNIKNKDFRKFIGDRFRATAYWLLIIDWLGEWWSPVGELTLVFSHKMWCKFEVAPFRNVLLECWT